MKEEYGFDNYKELSNNELRESDRLIIQLDSLPRLESERDFITGQGGILKKFDLIVLDEVEGLLIHFNATTLKEKERTFDILFKLCDKANKIFVFLFIENIKFLVKIYSNIFIYLKKRLANTGSDVGETIRGIRLKMQVHLLEVKQITQLQILMMYYLK